MTTPEHTLVGIHAALAVGLNRKYGWCLVALAGIVSNLPDWDGLPMFLDMSRFETAHRVWGHNLAWISFSSLVVAWLQFRFHWVDHLGERLNRYMPADVKVDPTRAYVPYWILLAVCVAVQLLHLPCDMVVSGGHGLSDWHIRPFWPVNDKGYVLPLIPWGDIGPTAILMAGLIVVAKRPRSAIGVSALTLLVLCLYLLIRGWARSVFN